VEIQAEDLELARSVGEDIATLIEDKIPSIIEPEISMGEGIPQVDIIVDRDKAYSLGLNLFNIGAEISANIDGRTATRYYSDGNEYDVVVSLMEEDRSSLSDLDRIFLLNNSGQKIALSSIATTRMSVAPAAINRENRKRVLHVTAGLAAGITPDEAERQLRRAMADTSWFPKG
jgi:HAE1 family hydrophobic/amphiphilic exporter-1